MSKTTWIILVVVAAIAAAAAGAAYTNKQYKPTAQKEGEKTLYTKG